MLGNFVIELLNIYTFCYNIFMKYIVLLIVVLILFIWSFFIEPNMLKVTEYNLQDRDLKGLKLVFAGDLHIKPNQENRLVEIIDKINAQNPDIILFAGDFAAGHKKDSTIPFSIYEKHLKRLNTKYGAYSVIGNHDYWAGYDNVKEMLERVGIKVLANSNESLILKNGKKLYIAGVEDLQTGSSNIKIALEGTESNPTILLTHSPDVFVEVLKDNVNLTLAGHVHGGQIRLPFIGALIIPSKYGNKYSQGLIEEKGRKMIVTKGIGTSILPLRFNCTPEIVVINFK